MKLCSPSPSEKHTSFSAGVNGGFEVFHQWFHTPSTVMESGSSKTKCLEQFTLPQQICLNEKQVKKHWKHYWSCLVTRILNNLWYMLFRSFNRVHTPLWKQMWSFWNFLRRSILGQYKDCTSYLQILYIILIPFSNRVPNCSQRWTNCWIQIRKKVNYTEQKINKQAKWHHLI